MTDQARLSKAVSHALRHEPWLYELELDEDGWASTDALLAALSQAEPAWRRLSVADLDAMIESSVKRRHEREGDRIRALYGHSVEGLLARLPSAPPTMLLHGTSPEAAVAIREEGLRPMGRRYVHLSVDVDTAAEVGRRKSRAPVILTVDAAAAASAGVAFYAGNDKVWLADAVPAAFITDRRD